MFTRIGGQDVWVEPMTQEELDAQTIDPRSRMAEQSADPKRGPRIKGTERIRAKPYAKPAPEMTKCFE